MVVVVVVGRGAAAAAAAEQVHAAPGPAPRRDTVGVGLFCVVAAGHQSAPPLVGQATRGERAPALAGAECAAGPHERFPRVALDTAPDEVHLAQRVMRIVLACGTEGAQPRKHAQCLCLHIIATRHCRASGRPGASGADDGHSRRKYPGERAALAVGQHMQGQRVAALGRREQPHRGLGRCLLASAAKATGRLGREDVLEAQRALGVGVARAGRVHALGQRPPPGLGVLIVVPVEIVPDGVD